MLLTTMCSVPVFNIYSFLQGAMKTAKYRKRCFDQIEGIVAENKTLAAEVDRLRSEVGEKVAEMTLRKSTVSSSPDA